MRISRFSEQQIIAAVRAVETGARVQDVCKELGISIATYYVWKKRFGTLDCDQAKQLRDVLEENRRLKQQVRRLTMDREILHTLAAQLA